MRNSGVETAGTGQSSPHATLARRAKRHWPVLAVAAVSAVLLFTNLGRDYLWEDEGDTAVLARTILHAGVPVAWDGVTFTDPDFGRRLTHDFVMVSHPWLQYYVTAGSFALFGETAFAARLPFAAAGFATILLVYFMTLRLLRNRVAAVSALILMLLSVQFLLFSRQARNYSLHALLTCLLVLQFYRLDSRRNALLFAVAAILLFHTHPIGLAAVAALGLLTIVYKPFKGQRRWFWPAAAAIGLYAAPWLVVSRSGYSANSAIVTDFGRSLSRFLQFCIECASVTPLVGVVILLAIIALRRRWQPRPAAVRRGHQPARAPLFTPEERSLMAIVATIGLAYGGAVALTQTRDMIWIVGARYTPALIPFSAMLAGLAIAKASGSNRATWVALMLVFGLTRFAQITPWTFWADPTPLRNPDDLVAVHQPNRIRDRILRTGQIAYVRSLTRPNPGVIEGISEFLKANAAPGDIVITNYAWEALYFHTGLPQGMKVLPSFPIYEAVRDHNLPRYVFTAEGVRWIVWRRVWAPYWGQDCEQILRRLAANGIRFRRVASIPETLYENRENIHFRRFAGAGHIFPWFDKLPDTLIYRVDWPRAGSTAPGQ